jgi:hypothetical protein
VDIRSVGLTAISIWLLAGTGAGGQTGSGAAYDQMIEGICRQYAAAVGATPTEVSFARCMGQRQCWVVPGSAKYHCEPPGPNIIHSSGG